MKKIRYVLIMLWALYSVPSNAAQISINIGINVPIYPELVVVPGYPVYYAPQLEANYFYYDGAYWVYQDDYWYESSWYNGPWVLVDPEFVPVFILRIPVFYYRRPPVYFHGWQSDAPPRWGEHWGRDWEQHRSGWDKWNHNVRRKPAPLPGYQKQYSGERYPRKVEQQHELQNRNYRYKSRQPAVQQHGQGTTQAIPRQESPPVQYRRQKSEPGADRREQKMQKSPGNETRQQGNKDSPRETKRGQGQDNERGRDR